MQFYQELATTMTGNDCRATAKWLEARCVMDMPVRRAATHWEHADEDLQFAIWAWLGFTESMDERCPLPKAIAADYRAAVDTACKLLND